MENKRIIYSTPDGGVAIIMPAIDCGLTIEEIAAKDVPPGVPYRIVDAASVPTDRTFRAAWRQKGAAIEHHMPTVREVAHTIRREFRAQEFAPLDAQVTIPGKAAQIEAQRQAVRDKYAALQLQIEAAATPETAKAALVAAIQ